GVLRGDLEGDRALGGGKLGVHLLNGQVDTLFETLAVLAQVACVRQDDAKRIFYGLLLCRADPGGLQSKQRQDDQKPDSDVKFAVHSFLLSSKKCIRAARHSIFVDHPPLSSVSQALGLTSS